MSNIRKMVDDLRRDFSELRQVLRKLMLGLWIYGNIQGKRHIGFRW